MPASGWGFMIWLLSCGSSRLWDFLGRSESVSSICTLAMLKGPVWVHGIVF